MAAIQKLCDRSQEVKDQMDTKNIEVQNVKENTEGKQEPYDAEVIDPITHLLIEETKLSSNNSFLNDTSEEFDSDTLVLLLGMGLDGEEVRLFKKHEIGLEKLITLTNSDLDYIGIPPKKKMNVMSCIRKLRKRKEKASLNSNDILSDIEYRPEDEQALKSVHRHQLTLIKILPCMKKYVMGHYECTFFQTGISSNHTFEKVTLCCVQQAIQTHKQLQLYLQELNEGVKSEHWYSRINMPNKRFVLSLIVGSCISLAVWCFKK